MPMPKKVSAPPTVDDFKRVAEAIRKTSQQARAMKTAGLTRKAIIVLLADATGLPRKDIGLVLDATEALSSWCLSQ